MGWRFPNPAAELHHKAQGSEFGHKTASDTGAADFPCIGVRLTINAVYQQRVRDSAVRLGVASTAASEIGTAWL